MKLKSIVGIAIINLMLFSCGNEKADKKEVVDASKEAVAFNYNVEQFADIKILNTKFLGGIN